MNSEKEKEQENRNYLRSERFEEESFEDYKARLKVVNAYLKNHSKGKAVWKSKKEVNPLVKAASKEEARLKAELDFYTSNWGTYIKKNSDDILKGYMDKVKDIAGKLKEVRNNQTIKSEENGA